MKKAYSLVQVTVSEKPILEPFSERVLESENQALREAFDASHWVIDVGSTPDFGRSVIFQTFEYHDFVTIDIPQRLVRILGVLADRSIFLCPVLDPEDLCGVGAVGILKTLTLLFSPL